MNSKKKINILFAIISILPILFFVKKIDNDFYFLYKYGEYVINYGFPHVEPFSMHEGLTFTMQQWLSAVIYYVIYNIFGEYGLILFLMVLFLLIAFIWFKNLLLVTNNKSTALILVLPITLCLFFFTYTRPFILSFLMLSIMFYFILNYTKTDKWYYLIALPIISVIQINIQSTMWWFLFVMILPFIAEIKIFNQKNIYTENYKKIPLIISFMLMIFCGFLNPYGLDNILYVFKSTSKISGVRIMEMATPTLTNIGGIILTLTFIFVILLLVNIKSKINIRYIFLLIGCFMLQLYAVRNIPFLGIALSLFACDLLKDKDLGEITNKKDSLRHLIIVSSVFIIAGVYFSIYDIIDKEKANEHFAIDYLVEQKIISDTDTIYTTYNTGNYALFRGLKVYVDARMEIYLESQNKKFSYVDEYFLLQDGAIDTEKFLQKYDFDFLLVPKTDILYGDVTENYIIIYEDDFCNVYKNIE